MPSCGSQVFLCDLPIRFDTYVGCSHACKYCFVLKKHDISDIKKGESVESLKRFISGHRTKDTVWADWPIPLHWGGMADPFQPCEAIHKVSLECLKVLAETQYPVVISTKGKIIAEDEYLDVLSQCNAITQISLVSPQFDKLELGAPTFAERIEVIRKVAPRVKRLIVRCQPYTREILGDLLRQIPLYKEIGVYGVIVEGMKYFKKMPGTVRIGGDFCYPKKALTSDFKLAREACHEHDLKFYSGENRLRNMGDSLCCCGVNKDDDIFKNDKHDNVHPNTANLNHMLYNKEGYVFSEAQSEIGSAMPFKTLIQTGIAYKVIDQKMSFKSAMEVCAKDKNAIKVFVGE